MDPLTVSFGGIALKYHYKFCPPPTRAHFHITNQQLPTKSPLGYMSHKTLTLSLFIHIYNGNKAYTHSTINAIMKCSLFVQVFWKLLFTCISFLQIPFIH